jgi:hypothetical protein
MRELKQMGDLYSDDDNTMFSFCAQDAKKKTCSDLWNKC